MKTDGKYKLKRIKIGGKSESNEISDRKHYRVKIDGDWYEGTFSKKWFGWNFEDSKGQIQMQLNLLDEAYEVVPIQVKDKRILKKKPAEEPLPVPEADTREGGND
jgi:hypothetical protein